MHNTEEVYMIRKWPAEHSRKLHPKPKFLVTAEAYLTAAQTMIHYLENKVGVLDFTKARVLVMF